MEIKTIMRMLEDEEPFTALSKFIDENQTGDAVNYIKNYCNCDYNMAKTAFEDFKINYDSLMSPSDLTPQQIAHNNAVAQEWLNKPHCPICNSTNLLKISTVKKATKIGLFGIFGAGDVGKTYKCNNCGSRF